jgi:hypothetical protein
MEALYHVQCTSSLFGRLLLVSEALTAFPQTTINNQLSQAEQSENQSINRNSVIKRLISKKSLFASPPR